MKTVIIGEKYRKKLENCLIDNGFETFWMDNNPDLDIRLASHADLSVFVYKKTVVLSSFLRENKVVNLLTKRGYDVKFSDIHQSDQYPNDINLCAAVIGENILHNKKYTDPLLIAFGLNMIDIKQGYARCSVLTVDDNSIITADNGIASAAKNAGIEVLEISPGGIELDGFNEGFIGGASFISEDTIYFVGDIETHSESLLIKKFISRRGKHLVCLCDGPLTDIGGAIYVK